jgi:pseudouridine synthase
MQSPNQIKVILKEGKNRQIRRMCKTLGFDVVNLQRIKIEHISLQDLKPGTFEHIQNDEFLTL